MTEQHWSFADVARRGSLPRSTVHHLATNEQPARTPHPQTLTRLAAGLDLPAEQVREAAAQAAGYTMLSATAKDPEVEILVAALGRLSREDRRHVAALVRSLLDRSRAQADGNGEAPLPPASDDVLGAVGAGFDIFPADAEAGGADAADAGPERGGQSGREPLPDAGSAQ
jgi:hypothetical protein